MCVVDVGSNKGYFSLLAAPRVLPGGRVISYEPHPRNLEDIQRTIDANGHTHWAARPLAVSCQSGAASLFTPGWEEGVSGWGSLDQRAGGPTIEVQTTTLDSDLNALGVDHVDLLKMDIQGHEFEAVQGAASLLAQGRLDVALIEVHVFALGPAKVRSLFALFKDSGYNPSLVRDNAGDRADWKRTRDGQFASGGAELTAVSAEDLLAAPPGFRPYVLWRRPSELPASRQTRVAVRSE
jgi:FkbM family methyltransferase